MKITCNIIEDLLPLYIDDMVSEDSRQLVEEHLKECAACRKMLDEMKKENQLRTVSGNAKRNSDRRTEIAPLKKIRRRIRRKRMISIILAAVLVLLASGIGHYWYYDKKTYISWDDAGMTLRDRKIYSKIDPDGHKTAILSVDQKNMFYMLSETAWIRKNYPSAQDAENLMFDLDEFQRAHDRLPDTATDETSLPTGIENVYYVDPENIKEAFALWDYQDEPDKAQQKDFWHCLGQIQVWLHWEKPICALFSWHHRFLCQIIQLRHLQETIMRHPLQWQAPLQEVCLILCSTIFLFFRPDSDSPVRHLQRQMPVLLSLARCCEV